MKPAPKLWKPGCWQDAVNELRALVMHRANQMRAYRDQRSADAPWTFEELKIRRAQRRLHHAIERAAMAIAHNEEPQP